MEPKTEASTFDIRPDFLEELKGKKVALRYKLRPDGAGLAPPFEGELVGNDGTFLKMKNLEAYQGRGTAKNPEVLVAIDSLATVEEAR